MTKTFTYTENEFAAIYSRNIKPIYLVCYSYTRTIHDAEDAAHDTFLKLIVSGNTFENMEHEKAWLIRTAINVCKDMLKHRRRRDVSLNDYENIEYHDSQIDDVYDAICTLPEKYRTIILLYYYEGYSSCDIAKILRKPQSTVTNYMSRARKTLRAELGEEWCHNDELTKQN